MAERSTCGRCGVYRDLHPTSTCETSRRLFWWDEHHLWRHVAAWLWLRLSDRRRMNLVHRYWSRHKHLCWCEFVDAALLDDKRDDYADDLCDVPLPVGVGLPRLGWCYCAPPAPESATDNFRVGECSPAPGCGCLCHRPGGMAVSHFAPCCDAPPESATDPSACVEGGDGL